MSKKRQSLKVLSWNVNGIRAVDRKGDLWQMLVAEEPDIFLIQEVKGTPGKLPQSVMEPEGYETHYQYAEKAGYAGVGIWIKKSLLEQKILENIKISTGMPEREQDEEGRVIHLEADWQGERWSWLSVYFPNGGKSEEAWQDKLVFYDEWLNFVNGLKESGRKVLWAGDLNVAHTEIDLARPRDNDGRIGFHPLEREWLDGVIAQGWMDIWRERNPNKVDIYSWWNAPTRARDRNVGWRIDYFFTDVANLNRIKDIKYLTEQMGSDHCPVVCKIL